MLSRSRCKHIDWIVLTSLKLTFASDLSGVRISYLVIEFPQIIADSFFLFLLFSAQVSPNREMTRFAYTSACQVGTPWALDAFWQWILWNICWHHLPMNPRLSVQAFMCGQEETEVKPIIAVLEFASFLPSVRLPVPLLIMWYSLCFIILLWRDMPQSILYGIGFGRGRRIWIILSHRKVHRMLKSFSAFLCAEVKQSMRYNSVLLVIALSCRSLTHWEGWAVH